MSNKAFTNYLTENGWKRMKIELHQLVYQERPAVTKTVQWAAGNGDRSENADYLYGKQRLREIDRRIRFLTQRLENAYVVDPATRQPTDQIFFGATVTYLSANGEEKMVSIVGIDEVDLAQHRISWISPLAKALLGAHEGDTVRIALPDGVETVDILRVRYQALL